MSPVALLHMLLNPILNASQDIRHVTLHGDVLIPTLKGVQGMSSFRRVEEDP